MFLPSGGHVSGAVAGRGWCKQFADRWNAACLALLLAVWPADAAASPEAGDSHAGPADGDTVAEQEGASTETAEASAPAFSSVVTPARRAEDTFESVRSVTVVDRTRLRDLQARTTPEALLEEPGVFLQSTQYGGGMPIIRGMHGNRVLLLVDGIRINNATTRSGPNQYLNTVDPLLVHRIEVLRGVGSATHGSDAIGGVVNVSTEDPDVGRAADVSGETILRGASADASAAAAGRLRYQSPRVGVLASASVQHFGDLRGGRETGLQFPTAYDAANASLAAKVALSSRVSVLTKAQATRQYSVPRAYGSTPLDFRVFTHQDRTLGFSRLSLTETGGWEEIRLTASLHHQGEQLDRYRISQDLRECDRTIVMTLGLQADAVRRFTRGALTVGAEFYADDIEIQSYQGQLGNDSLGERSEITRYPAGSSYASGGVFANFVQPVGIRTSLVAEARVGAVRVSLPEDRRLPLLFPEQGLDVLPSLVQTIPTYAGGVHLRYVLSDGVALNGGVSLGFRAPNLDDYGRLGAEGPVFMVPTRTLRPERAVSGESAIKVAREHCEAMVTYAYTVIDNAMGRNFTQIGDTTELDGEPLATVVNGDSARFHTLEGAVRWKVWGRFYVAAHGAVTYGEQRTATLLDDGSTLLVTEPTPKTPPPYGGASVGYRDWRRGFHLEAVARWALGQTRLSEYDRKDGRICPEVPGECTGTPGWFIGGLRGGVRIGRSIHVSLEVHNLGDTTYRMHASGIDGPGLGVVATLEGVI